MFTWTWNDAHTAWKYSIKRLSSEWVSFFYAVCSIIPSISHWGDTRIWIIVPMWGFEPLPPLHKVIFTLQLLKIYVKVLELALRSPCGMGPGLEPDEDRTTWIPSPSVSRLKILTHHDSTAWGHLHGTFTHIASRISVVFYSETYAHIMIECQGQSLQTVVQANLCEYFVYWQTLEHAIFLYLWTWQEGCPVYWNMKLACLNMLCPAYTVFD